MADQGDFQNMDFEIFKQNKFQMVFQSGNYSKYLAYVCNTCENYASIVQDHGKSSPNMKSHQTGKHDKKR